MRWKFVEQFKRMERWEQRIEVIAKNVPKDMGDFEDQDDFLAFFQNCFHLKDWIINDEDLGISKKEVENFISNSTCLKICGDLCIGAKHLKIDRPRTDSSTKINRHYIVGESISSPIQRRDFIITSSGKEYNALLIAKECTKAWKGFFVKKGMSWF